MWIWLKIIIFVPDLCKFRLFKEKGKTGSGEDISGQYTLPLKSAGTRWGTGPFTEETGAGHAQNDLTLFWSVSASPLVSAYTSSLM